MHRKVNDQIVNTNNVSIKTWTHAGFLFHFARLDILRYKVIYTIAILQFFVEPCAPSNYHDKN